MNKLNHGWVAFAVLLFVVLIFSVPAMKGYSVYRAMKDSGVDDEYVDSMVALETAKEAAEKQAEVASETAVKAQEESATAVGTAASAEAELKSCWELAAAEKSLCGNLADSLAQEKADVQGKLNDARSVLQNLANSHCCIQKVFQPEIVGYDIDKEEVICTTDGGTILSC